MTHSSPATPPSRLFGRRLVKVRFQLKFSLAIFALLGLSTVALWAFGHRFVTHLAEAGLIEPEQVTVHMTVLNQVVVRTSVFTWILAFGCALFFSHYIAGPLYRVERILRRMQGGDLSMRVSFRRRDELQELAQALDETVASLRNRVEQEREALRRCAVELETLARNLPASIPSAAELQRLAAFLRSHPQGFTTFEASPAAAVPATSPPENS